MLEQISKLRIVIIPLITLVLGAVLGSVRAANSVEVTDTGPWQMQVPYQGIYVQAVADAYAADGNLTLAAERLSFLCQANGGLESAFTEASARYGQADPQRQANLDELRSLVASGQATQNPDAQIGVCQTQPQNANPLFALLSLVLLLLIAVSFVGFGVFLMIRADEKQDVKPAAAPAGRPAAPAAGPAPAASRPAGSPAPAPGAAPSPPPPQPKTEERSRAGGGLPFMGRKEPAPQGAPAEPRSVAAMGAQISATAEKTDYSMAAEGPPIVQFMTTYLQGDDLYDDSFSIETPSGEFLGETGVSISETLNSGDPSKKVIAFEVWLFDKNDIRTVTKVLMSDFAFGNDGVRAKLAPKGDAVMIRPGERVSLETASLRVQARLVDLNYASGGYPPNSVIDRVTVELAAWRKS